MVLFQEVSVIAVSRFPIYILGISAGVYASEQKNVEILQSYRNNKVISVMLIYTIGIIGFIWLGFLFLNKDHISPYLYNVWLPCALTTPAVVYTSCIFLETLSKCRVGRRLVGFLSFIGNFTLDEYLLHIILFNRLGIIFEGYYDMEKPHPFAIKNFIFWIIIVTITICTSYLYKFMIDRFMIIITAKRCNNN